MILYLANFKTVTYLLDQVSRPEIETSKAKAREESHPYQAVAGITKIIKHGDDDDGESAGEEEVATEEGSESDGTDDSSGGIPIAKQFCSRFFERHVIGTYCRVWSRG